MTFGLVCCFIILLFFLPAPTLHNTFHTPMAQCRLFVLKVPLNANQPTQFTMRAHQSNAKQLYSSYSCEM